MSKVFIGANKAEDWKSLLAEPEKHWKPGHSAMALAHCWQEADGFPRSVNKAFINSKIELFRDIRILFAFPEYKVPLPGGTRPSQNDIFVIAKSGNELVSIAVEGKVSEPFGSTVGEWKKGLNNDDSGKTIRLNFLKSKLGLNQDLNVDSIRYQLFHRTASAIIKAEDLNASKALMLVHSFSQTDEWFDDYVSFLRLFDLTGEKNVILGPVKVNDIEVYFGWVRGEAKYLSC